MRTQHAAAALAAKYPHTIEEAAKLLGVHTDTLRRWLVAGEIPGIRLGKHWRLNADDLGDKVRVNAAVASEAAGIPEVES